MKHASLIVLFVGLLWTFILFLRGNMTKVYEQQQKHVMRPLLANIIRRYPGPCATVNSPWRVPQQDLRIIHGTEVSGGMYPFIGSIFYENMFLCSCCLITPTLALGAAHCLIYTNLTLVFGSVTLNPLSEQAVKRSVTSINIHPDFDSSTYDSDLAVFRFDAIDSVYPACLCYTDVEAPTEFILAGWGLTESGTLSNVLRETRLQRSYFCQQYDQDKHICASNTTLRSGPCGGDSGSPLFFIGPGDVYVVCGVVSRGSKTCVSRPTVFTKVSRYVQWITSFFDN